MPPPPNPALTIFWDNKRQEGSCRYNIRIGYRHTSSRHPLLPHKPSIQQLDELIVPILGQAYVRYPSVGLGTCPHPTITDQITDQYAPYCDELGYAVCNDIRVLAVIRCSSREPIPPRCATDQQIRAVFW